MTEFFPPVTEGYRAYTGIGSQATPEDILELMSAISGVLLRRGWTLRSGGADGADKAFEWNIPLFRREIFLPWEGFNNTKGIDVSALPNFREAMSIASQYHPAWWNCSEGARKLHARNSYQVLGEGLDKLTEAVICWTRNGKPCGGTGQALRLAEAHEVPIYNLYYPEVRERFYALLREDRASAEA